MLRKLLVGVLAAAAGGALAAGVAAHTTSTESSVSINIAPSETYVYGAVSSPKAKCEGRRRVSVFRKRAGDDELYGDTRSLEGGGTYTVENGTLASGTYYSRVRKRDLSPGARHAHICKAARSANAPVVP